MNDAQNEFTSSTSFTTEDYYKLLGAISGESNKVIYNLTAQQYKDSFKYPRSAKKIISMLRNLELYGFASYIE